MLQVRVPVRTGGQVDAMASCTVGFCVPEINHT